MTSRDIQFVCPKCSGSAFGSSQEDDGSLARYCHGNDAKDSNVEHCSFMFPEANDWKFFTVYGQHVTKDQYAEAMKELTDDLNRQIDETNRRFPSSHSF